MSSSPPNLPPRDEPAGRVRARAETPPPHYWRRWAADAVPEGAGGEADGSAAGATGGAGAGSDAGASDKPPPYRVLIVEDDRPQALFAQSVLHGAGMQASVQSTSEGVLEAIATFRPELVLMDLHMPGTNGMQLTTEIRRNPEFQLLPIVFLTGDPDPERQFEVLDQGADDFLNKPIRPRHLISAVSNRIQRARMQAAAQAPANTRSNPDTGLLTRSYLLQSLTDALQAGTPGGLLFVEVASALSLRERYGYAAFEKLMAEAGRELLALAAPQAIARLNDNSFLVLARDLADDQLDGFARKLRDGLAAREFRVSADETLRLRCSVGHARLSFGFADAGGALEATERAALLARLKPDSVAEYVPTASPEEQERVAVLEGQLELAYQPIVAVAGGDVAQYQVLLRMRQADGTLLSAGQVVPVAEAAGAIADLDQRVLEHALDVLSLKKHEDRVLRLFVSQSPRTLARDAFADWVLNAITERGIAGTSIVIDLRLGDALIHTVTVREFCNRVMPAGVQFCISQFEASPEADALLGQLPLGYVRMSSKYAESHGDPTLRDQLRGTINHAHALGLQVIGQQIEDPQAAAAMWMGGVDFIQGNLVQSVGNELDFDFQHAVL